MEEVIAYEGVVKTSLGILRKEHGALFLPSANRRIGIEGTHARAPYTSADFDTFLERLQKSRGELEAFALLAFEEKENGRMYRYIGHTSIGKIKWPDGYGVTGSVMSDVSAQGVGHGTEAKLLLLYHCFMILGLRTIRSAVKGWNAKSLGHLIKCGYRIVGRYPECVFHEGRLVDEIVLQCGREDWQRVWETYQNDKTLPKLTDQQRALVKEETQQ